MIDCDTDDRTGTPIRVAAPRGPSILSAGIAAALRATPGVKVVTLAQLDSERRESGAQADVLLMEDVPSLPPAAAIAAAASRPRSSTARERPAGVVLVMQDPSIERIVAYLRSGVRAFVCHDASLDDLLDAVCSTAREEVFLPHGIAVQIIDGILPHLPFFTPGTPSPIDRLTIREREVFSHVTAGRSNAEIAEACSLSQKTVKFHVSNILHKLGMKNRLQAVAHAYQTAQKAA
ncbi:LuxR C-terminal-related transcriptional regulator [Streptomyces sp. NPDC059568]|uniref:helix-turn-helix transcriptional regulator n=1 Tax=unclassified Streptomyces TaxID=2593676 RepID=UPI00367C89FA